MIKVACIYKDKDKFENRINKEGINRELNYFIRIISSAVDSATSVQIAKEVKKILPNSEILGCCAPGFIYNGDIMENGTLVLIQHYENNSVKIETFSWEEKTTGELAGNIYSEFSDDLDNPVHVLFSNSFLDVDNFVREFNMHTPVAKLVGGVLSPFHADNDKYYVFDETGRGKNCVVAFQLRGPMKNEINYNIPSDPISNVFQITDIKDGVIREIDGKPSKEWFRNYFDINNSNNDFMFKDSYLLYFLFLIEQHNGAGRFLRYDKENDCLSLYYSDLPNKTKFRVGFFNPMISREQMYQMYQSMQENCIDSLFAYTCIFRKEFFGKVIETELMPLKKTGLMGLFLCGEFCYINGQNEYLNGSFLISEVSEGTGKCEIDLEALNHTAEIKLDDSLVEFVMKEKRDELRKQADFFGNKDMENLDVDTNFMNIFQYKSDSKKINFNRNIMVYIENADMVIGSEGYKVYIDTVVQAINGIRDAVQQDYTHKMYIYELNYCTFILGAKAQVSKEECYTYLTNLFKKNRIIISPDNNIPLICKYVLVFEGEDKLQIGLNCLQQINANNMPYFVYDGDDNEMRSSEIASDELTVINLLKKAIESDGIVPYYQGLYNNELKKIDGYESLMRMKVDDKVYPPGMFMDIAKKYNFYLILSRAMINKVLRDFEDKDIKVSVNISAYEISSPSFCSWLWKKLDNYKNTENLIFEIVESEELADKQQAVDFVEKVRKYGIGIAIDDFGTGYSNILQIIDIDPQYIKIDGSIVKSLMTNKNSRTVISVIQYIADSIGADVVGEFVETEELQQILIEERIKFTQGYLFSQPKPLEERDR